MKKAEASCCFWPERSLAVFDRSAALALLALLMVGKGMLQETLNVMLAAAATTSTPTACRVPVHWSGKKNVTIDVGDLNRTFRLSSPWAEHPCTPSQRYTCRSGAPIVSAPLVLYWHKRSRNRPVLDYSLDISKVEDVAADRGYFAITPIGTPHEGRWWPVRL